MSGRKMVKNNLIFLCLGDKEVFGSYVVENLLDKYDIVVNYFGDDDHKIKYFTKHSIFFQHKKGTKFLSLRDIYLHSPNIFEQYSYVVCWDDDARIETGSICSLIDLMKTFKLKILSPAHNNITKISHNIMRTYPGNHLLRFTNFVEMTFPIFKMSFIKEYLHEYDGSCCGFGNDWWYMSLIEDRGSKYDVGICDSVVVTNPRNSVRKDNISCYLSTTDRHQEWEKTKVKYDLHQWSPKTLAYVHTINNEIILTPTIIMP